MDRRGLVNLRKCFKPKPTTLILGKELSRGSYGVVYLSKLGDKPVAVKKIHGILLGSQHLLESFVQECEIMKNLDHINVVGFIGAYYDGNEPLLVMELMNDSLENYLSDRRGKLSLKRQLEIVTSIAEGLKYLHERKNPIIHRDLSDKNVLLLKNGTVKISDLGQAKLLDNRSQFLKTTQPGTVAYLPPEALKKGGEYTAKVDAFSLGVLMLEISTQHQPQVEWMGIGTTPEMVRREKDLKMLSDKHVIKPLIVWCFQDSEMRPDVATVHSHVSTFLANVQVWEDKEDLEDEAQARKRHEHALREQLEKVIIDRDAIKESEAALTVEVSKQKQTIKKLESDLIERDNSVHSHIRQLESAKREKEKLDRKVKEQQDKLSTANATVREKRTEEQKLTHALQAAERRVETEQAGLRRELTLKAQQYDTKMAQHSREIGHKDSLIQKHVATITERDDQITRLKKEADGLRRKLKAHEDEKIIMKRQQDELTAEKEEMKMTIESQKSQITELREECEDLQIEVADRKRIEKDLWKHSRDYLDKKIGMMAEIQLAADKIKKLKKKNGQISAENDRLSIELARLKLYDPADEYLTPDEDSMDEPKKTSWWPFSGSSTPKKNRSCSTGSSGNLSSTQLQSKISPIVESSVDGKLSINTDDSESAFWEKEEEISPTPPSNKQMDPAPRQKRHSVIPLEEETTPVTVRAMSTYLRDLGSPKTYQSRIQQNTAYSSSTKVSTLRKLYDTTSTNDAIGLPAGKLQHQKSPVLPRESSTGNHMAAGSLPKLGLKRSKSAVVRSRNPRPNGHTCPHCHKDISSMTSPQHHIQKCKNRRSFPSVKEI